MMENPGHLNQPLLRIAIDRRQDASHGRGGGGGGGRDKRRVARLWLDGGQTVFRTEESPPECDCAFSKNINTYRDRTTEPDHATPLSPGALNIFAAASPVVTASYSLLLCIPPLRPTSDPAKRRPSHRHPPKSIPFLSPIVQPVDLP